MPRHFIKIIALEVKFLIRFLLERECLLTRLSLLKRIRLGSVRSSHLPLKMH